MTKSAGGGQSPRCKFWGDLSPRPPRDLRPWSQGSAAVPKGSKVRPVNHICIRTNTIIILLRMQNIWRSN